MKKHNKMKANDNVGLWTRIKKFQVILGSFMILMPLILILREGFVRQSISNYAYSSHPQDLPILLTLIACLFFIDAVVHREKWYNFVLGAFLIGIALTPHLDYPMTHYLFTGAYFVGSAFVMIYYSSTKQRFWKIIAGVIMVVTLALAFFFNVLSVFLAEWIGILPMGIHYIGEAIDKID